MKKKLNNLFMRLVSKMYRWHTKQAKYYSDLYVKYNLKEFSISYIDWVNETEEIEIPHAYVDGYSRWHKYDYSWLFAVLHKYSLKVK